MCTVQCSALMNCHVPCNAVSCCDVLCCDVPCACDVRDMCGVTRVPALCAVRWRIAHGAVVCQISLEEPNACQQTLSWLRRQLPAHTKHRGWHFEQFQQTQAFMMTLALMAAQAAAASKHQHCQRHCQQNTASNSVSTSASTTASIITGTTTGSTTTSSNTCIDAVHTNTSIATHCSQRFSA